MSKRNLSGFCVFGLRLSIVLFALSFSTFAQGNNPLILIPGFSGSELRHKVTNERVWFRTIRSKSEDLRLPVVADPTKTSDELIATDVLRTVKIGIFPVTDVYGGFIRAMAERGGYREESWDAPSDEGDHDSLYVFPYDWRLDNVENARLLIERVEALRCKLDRPDLKFDIVAHSMGGIISRYAAMYGDNDLPTGSSKPLPTWAGAKFFDKIILLGTPNEGSALALGSLVEGFTYGGMRLDLPFVQDTSKFTAFTIPAAYQLLPAPNTFRAYDDNLKRIDLDIYDPKTWSKFGWNASSDKNFPSQYNANELKAAPVFFAAALDRAKRLYQALDAAPGESGGISFFIVGSDCRAALDSVIVYRDERSDKWKTLFRPKGFTRPDGTKVSDEDLKRVMQTPGDGVVTQRSLEAVTKSGTVGSQSIVGDASDKFICEEHNRLAVNSKIQDYIIKVLDGRVLPVAGVKEK